MVPACSVHYVYIQGTPINNSPLEKILYFSKDSMDLSQTFRITLKFNFAVEHTIVH